MELDAQLSSLLTSALRNRDAGAAAAPLSRSAAQSNVARAGELLRQHQRRRATTSLARLTAPSCAAAAEAVIATQVNSGFVEWALQLARNLDAVGRLAQTVVFCEDEAAARAMRGVRGATNGATPRVFYDARIASNVSERRRRDRHAEYLQIAYNKSLYVLLLLRARRAVLFLDADVSVVCDPLPWLLRHAAAADVLVTSDAPDRGNDNGEYNGGVFFARPTPAAIAAFERMDASARRPSCGADMRGARCNDLRGVAHQRLFNLALAAPARGGGGGRAGAARVRMVESELFQSGRARLQLRKAGAEFARMPVLVHHSGVDDLARKAAAARRDGLWQAEGAPPPAVLFRRAAGAALLGGCAVPAPCANRSSG